MPVDNNTVSPTFFSVQQQSAICCFILSVGEVSNIHRFTFLCHPGLNLIPLGQMYLSHFLTAIIQPLMPDPFLSIKSAFPDEFCPDTLSFLLKNPATWEKLCLPSSSSSSILFLLGAWLSLLAVPYPLLFSSYWPLFASCREPSRWHFILVFFSPYLIASYAAVFSLLCICSLPSQ